MPWLRPDRHHALPGVPGPRLPGSLAAGKVEPLERVIDRGPPPGMQLRPPHEARYRKVHDRKARRREAGWNDNPAPWPENSRCRLGWPW